ncbi:Gfo/Idh/MocA family oxidoreductase [Kitasatospora sp. HPMI-4]|uniref:Gfo/Idh/MocA family oxidoreductase n=1 Tax=Kitasatospora sp. HPMI-4 TaxID=3448443 RepID=UPI003F197FE6
MRVAAIGAGLGEQYLDRLSRHSNAKTDILNFQPDLGQDERIATKRHTPRVGDNVDETIEDGCDLVVTAAPARLRSRWAGRALTLAKAVVREKPRPP